MISAWPEYAEQNGILQEDEEAVEIIKEAVRSDPKCAYRHECTAEQERHRYLLYPRMQKSVRSLRTAKYFFATLGYASEVDRTGRQGRNR